MIRTEAVPWPRLAFIATLTFLAVTTIGTVTGAAAGIVHACELRKIEIIAGAEKRTFLVEVADDSRQQAQGLMFRPSLPVDAGMLFVFDPPRQAKFWMRNTMIPLDMIFIDDTGKVESIAERNDSYSERVSSSQADVRAVLEINGGQSRQLGIEPGAQVIHRVFENAPDGMRCLK
jgi:uncharacterized membrane protein (UPF0127 family)